MRSYKVHEVSYFIIILLPSVHRLRIYSNMVFNNIGITAFIVARACYSINYSSYSL